VADVVVVSTRADDDHVTGDWHPERPARLLAVERGLDAARVELAHLPPRDATIEELERVHHPAHLQALRRFIDAGGGDLDPDTPTSPGSWRTALRSAGAALVAVDALRDGAAPAAFVACRPPGHHATPARAMGFCLLNNVAVAARALTAAGERVVILDWDVHHGNGTQDVFWDDPAVLYASFHEWPAYPGTGRATETGGAGAPGLTLNVPLPAGATGDVALRAFDELVLPAASAFAPTWILISAGYDAHRDDPLAGLAWSAGDYTALTMRAMTLAPLPGRTIAVLEGGYDLDALARSVEATANALGGTPSSPEAATSGGPGGSAIEAARRARARGDEEGWL
jgi:acetoin utilization deacetylase AcuC-like enzyme